MSILLVDSSLDTRFRTRSLLTRAGHKDVTAVQTFGEVKRLLAKGGSLAYKVDLIVIHFDEFGLELCGYLNEQPQTRNIPVIVIVDEDDSELMRLLFGLGVRDVVPQPLHDEAFAARVRQLLLLKFERDELLAQREQTRLIMKHLQDANRILQKLSNLDGLTGVMNRRSFDELVTNEWKRAARQGYPLSLVMVDIDFFKQYNDAYGHVQGDECLKKVAAALKGTLKRAGDAVARFGGEEFTALLPNTDRVGAAAVAESLRAAIAELRIAHRDSTAADVITVSCGVGTVCPHEGGQPQHLVAMADEALYEAKRSGRNRVVVHGSEAEADDVRPSNAQPTELQAVKDQLQTLERLVRSMAAFRQETEGVAQQKTAELQPTLTAAELAELRRSQQSEPEPNPAAADPTAHNEHSPAKPLQNDENMLVRDRQNQEAEYPSASWQERARAAGPDNHCDEGLGGSMRPGEEQSGQCVAEEDQRETEQQHAAETAKLAERSLEANAEERHGMAEGKEDTLWTSFFDQTSHAVVQVDNDGCIVKGNPTFFLSFWQTEDMERPGAADHTEGGKAQPVLPYGSARGEGIGLPLTELIYAADRPQLQQALQDILDESLVTVSVDARTVTGKHWWQWEILSLGPEGCIQGALLCGRDITAARDMEKKLELRTKLLKQLSNLA